MRALLAYPTHENCREAEAPYARDGFHVAIYPGRVTEGSENLSQNCWNLQADEAERIGLPVVATVCTTCDHRATCLCHGYLAQLKDAEIADIALCTHKRVEHTSLTVLMQGRQYCSIHENPVDLLRPPLNLSEADLVQAKLVIYRMLNDPGFLNWFADALRVDDDGRRYEDKELAVRKDRQYQFCRLLADLIDDLLQKLNTSDTTSEWTFAEPRKKPQGIERTRFFAIRTAGVTFRDQPWRFLMAAATGDLHSAAILVTTRYQKGGGSGNKFLVKAVCGFRNNPPCPGVVTWFNDATLIADRLATILGQPVNDWTPQGHIPLRKKAVQILRDVTRRTSARILANTLRGVLADRPQFTRVGVICHSVHTTVVKSLGGEYSARITKVAHFGSGEDRSSNDWHTQCDLIVIVGTPRVPPAEVMKYLVQVGEIGAAQREPEWVDLYWIGKTEAGEDVRVQGRGYEDATWRAAQRDLVRASLVQAIGRGRGILATGCEVVVLSSEECGIPISDSRLTSMNEATTKVIGAITHLSAPFPNNTYLGNGAPKSSQIALRAGLSLRQTQKILQSLERRGLVRKVGERCGWCLVSAEAEAC